MHGNWWTFGGMFFKLGSLILLVANVTQFIVREVRVLDASDCGIAFKLHCCRD